jgi:RHS repeat-associated protein
LSTVTDALNRITTFGYTNHQVTSMTLPGVLTYSYGYDTARRLRTIQDPTGATTTLAYDTANRLAAVTDALSHTTSYGYDGYNRVTTVTDPLSGIMTYTYATSGVNTKVEYPDGTTVSSLYDAATLTQRIVEFGGSGPTYLERTTTIVFDARKMPVAVTDPTNLTTSFSYDAVGRLTGVQDPLTNRSTVVYDLAGNVAAVVDPLTHRTSFTYDARNRQTVVQDALTNLTTTIYDAAGNVSAVVDPRTYRTSFTYDELNRLTEVQDALTNRTTTTYDAGGNVQAVVDARLDRTTYAYDGVGRLTVVKDALANLATTVYDAVGNVTVTVDPKGNRTTTTYDALDRATVVQDALTNLTTYTYGSNRQLESVQTPLTHRTSFVYDALLRNTVVIDPLTNRTTTVFDLADRVSVSIDGLGHRTTNTYDAAGQLTVVQDALNNLTTMTYDAAGRQTSLRDASNNVTTWTYDFVGRVATETDALGNPRTYAYDAVGNLVQRIDRRGLYTTYTYDALNRLTTQSVVVPEYSAGMVHLVSGVNTFAYDAVGNLTSAVGPHTGYTITYDAADRASFVSEPFGLTLSMAYDAAGNRTRVDDAKNGVTTSTYDVLNRLSGRELGGSGVTKQKVTWSYTADGASDTTTRYKWTGSAFASVGTTTYGYDAADRLTLIRHADGSNTTLATYAYGYDAANRLTSETINGTPLTYGYDVADQLTFNNGTTLAYDATGNRTNGSQYDAGNRLVTDGYWHYYYDGEGNVVERDGFNGEAWFIAYDLEDRAIGWGRQESVGANVVVSMVYDVDPFGNRVERATYNAAGGVLTDDRYGFDGWDPAKPVAVGTENFDAWVDLDSGNNLTVRRLYGAGFNELVSRQDSGGTVLWYGTDRLGSVRLTLDNSTGAAVNELRYEAFGGITYGAPTDRFAFQGMEWDPIFFAYIDRARMYDPTSGRFTTADPLGFATGDSNLYRYTGNNPTNFTDPSGFQDKKQNPNDQFSTTVCNTIVSEIKAALKSAQESLDSSQKLKASIESDIKELNRADKSWHDLANRAATRGEVNTALKAINDIRNELGDKGEQLGEAIKVVGSNESRAKHLKDYLKQMEDYCKWCKTNIEIKERIDKDKDKINKMGKDLYDKLRGIVDPNIPNTFDAPGSRK